MNAAKETDVSGTEWTEPGQGATVINIEAALVDSQEQGAISTRDLHSALASVSLFSPGSRTNLRLTGSPLTAEDLQRIAECEVDAR